MLKPRFEKYYRDVVSEDLVLLYNFSTISELPRFDRAIFNLTSKRFRDSKQDKIKGFSAAFLTTGQKSVTTRARKSIAQFSVRKDNLLGEKVSIRGSKLLNFLDKILLFVIPRQSNSGLKANHFLLQADKKNRFSGGGHPSPKVLGVSFASPKVKVPYDHLAIDSSKKQSREQTIKSQIERPVQFDLAGETLKIFPEVANLFSFFDKTDNSNSDRSGYSINLVCNIPHKRVRTLDFFSFLRSNKRRIRKPNQNVVPVNKLDLDPQIQNLNDFAKSVQVNQALFLQKHQQFLSAFQYA